MIRNLACGPNYKKCEDPLLDSGDSSDAQIQDSKVSGQEEVWQHELRERPKARLEDNASQSAGSGERCSRLGSSLVGVKIVTAGLADEIRRKALAK